MLEYTHVPGCSHLQRRVRILLKETKHQKVVKCVIHWKSITEGPEGPQVLMDCSKCFSCTFRHHMVQFLCR